MEDKNELEGLGGWLILVGIGVVFAPVRLLFELVPIYNLVFAENVIAAMTDPNSQVYNPFFLPLIVGEGLGNSIIFLACLWMIYLYFSRHYLFPRVFVVMAIGVPIFILADTWVVSLVVPGTPMFDPDTVKVLMRSLISAVIWVPYMIVSKRVALTFVENVPPLPDCPAIAPGSDTGAV